RVAPLLDHPVVVGLHTLEPELVVLALQEGLAAEAGEGRERDRAVDAGQRQILHPRLGLVATGPHLVVGDGGEEHLVGVELADVPVGCGVEGNGDVALVDVDELVLVEPVVAPAAVLGHLLLVGSADVEGEVPPPGPLDPRALLAHLGGQAVLPHMGGLDDVVVDADDLRKIGVIQCHWAPSASGSCWIPESKPPCLRMNVVERRRMRQPSGVRTYSSLYQPRRMPCVCWSTKMKCCLPVAVAAPPSSSSNSTTGAFPMNWPRGAAASRAGKRSSVYGVPKAVYTASGVNTSSHRSSMN